MRRLMLSRQADASTSWLHRNWIQSDLADDFFFGSDFFLGLESELVDEESLEVLFDSEDELLEDSEGVLDVSAGELLDFEPRASFL